MKSPAIVLMIAMAAMTAAVAARRHTVASAAFRASRSAAAATGRDPNGAAASVRLFPRPAAIGPMARRIATAAALATAMRPRRLDFARKAALDVGGAASSSHRPNGAS
jgi:threonine/homoserine efflux transporter RhtA